MAVHRNHVTAPEEVRVSKADNQPRLVITAGQASQEYWRDLWRYRELFYFLVKRNVSVRYKQTIIGIAWVLIRPLITVVVFTLVFSRIANLPSDGAPYSLLVLAGLIPWFFFATSLSESSLSLVANANLVSKVYFPRLLLPMTAVGTALVDLMATFAVLVIVMAWFGVTPSARIAALPLFVMLAMATALGLGFWLAAINVRYRDVQHIVPLLLQLGLFISPLGFTSAIVPDHWRAVFILNPMVGPIEGFRWALLEGNFPLRLDALLSSAVIGSFTVAGGLWFFRRTERAIADVI